MSDLNKKLSSIQYSLKSLKDSFNAFGKYSYRSCESILESLKPHLEEIGVSVTLSDEVVAVGDRIYIKATAKISDGTNDICTTAFAREPRDRKGMDESQITGSASSYARKYALCGLFAIDDNKDADYLNGEQGNAKPVDKPVDKPKVKAEVKAVELPAYPQSDFEDNQKAWAEAIKTKKTTPQILIAKMSTRGVLSDEQKQIIEGFAK